MKKYFLLLLTIFLVSCKSNEEKAAELIKDYMFNHLVDFESYEPIETTELDSLYYTSYYNPTIRQWAEIIDKYFTEVEEISERMEEHKRTLEIYGDSYYSSYGRKKRTEASEGWDKEKAKLKSVLEKIGECEKEIREISSKDVLDESFCFGMIAKHKFRCKNRGGNYTIGNYQFIFDNEIENIYYTLDEDDEKEGRLRAYIKRALAQGL